MARRKRRNMKHQYRYEVSVMDWHANVTFNDYAYFNLFDREEFEETFCMVLEGRISSTMSKKCKEGMAAEVIIYSGDFWYDKHRLRDDVHTIGNMDIQKANSYSHKEDTLYFRVSIPTKSYENIRDFLTYKGKALISLVGTELHWRKGEIYYLDFGKQPD
jgi:hypothetical protein